MFELRFSDGVERGMTCDGHAPVYVTKQGSQIMPGDWKRFRRALDMMPDGLSPAPNAGATGHEREAEERLTKLRQELETLIGAGGLDLLDESKGKIIALLNRHCGSATKARRAGADKADDDDDDAFAKYLRGRGLDESDIEEAKRIVASYEAPASDKLPVNALRGGYSGRLSGRSRDDAEAHLLERFGPDGPIRIGAAVPGRGEFDDAQHDRRGARDRRLAADRADGEANFLRRFPEAAHIGIGPWPRRA
jgi:hypothetical protein